MFFIVFWVFDIIILGVCIFGFFCNLKLVFNIMFDFYFSNKIVNMESIIDFG